MNVYAPAERATAAPNVIRTLEGLRRIDLASLRPREEPNAILMCTPGHFDVQYEINAKMVGNIGQVDRIKAKLQWCKLFEALIPGRVQVVKGMPGLLDMMFAANAAITWKEPSGEKRCLMSNMRYKQRCGETPHYKTYLGELGYEVLSPLWGNLFFEGQGDALWHPGKMLLWGGHGFRSTPEAYALISSTVDMPVILLELVLPEFYHLDTCFCPLDEKSVLYYPKAFTKAGVQMIEWMFEKTLPVTSEQADLYTCNSIVRGKDVVMPAKDAEICRILGEWGFAAKHVQMDEANKSGGAAACCGLAHYL